MEKFKTAEPVKDIAEVLGYKADMARDEYRPLMGIREILLEAKKEIEFLRLRIESLNAEVSRLNQVAQYY